MNKRYVLFNIIAFIIYFVTLENTNVMSWNVETVRFRFAINVISAIAFKKLPDPVPYTSTATRTFEKDTSDLHLACQQTELFWTPSPETSVAWNDRKTSPSVEFHRPHLGDMDMEHTAAQRSLCASPYAICFSTFTWSHGTLDWWSVFITKSNNR